MPMGFLDSAGFSYRKFKKENKKKHYEKKCGPVSIGFCFSTLSQRALSVAQKGRWTVTDSKELTFLFSDSEIKSDVPPFSLRNLQNEHFSNHTLTTALMIVRHRPL